MNLHADFAERIRTIAGRIGLGTPEALSAAKIVVEPPREAGHGDLACNVAMVLAKQAGRKPREIATEIAAHLVDDPDVASAEVAGPGFLNIRLADAMWPRLLAGVLEEGATSAAATSAAGGRSTSNTSRRTRPGRCTSATAVAPCSATRSPRCSPSRAMA